MASESFTRVFRRSPAQVPWRAAAVLSLAAVLVSSALPARVLAQGCHAGRSPSDLLSGDLGPASADFSRLLHCLEIRNDRDAPRSDEVAFSGVPIPREAALTDVGSLVVIGPGGRRIAAQFDVLSRWGGPLDADELPIRWLSVSTAAAVDAEASSFYELRRRDEPSQVNDPYAATIRAEQGGYVVETGLASFVLDPDQPALVEQIALLGAAGQGPASVIYAHTPGAGPRLVFESDSGAVTLDTSSPGAVSVDPDGFEIVEAGPVKVVVSLEGHFSAPGGSSLCLATTAPYERFGYTVIATFTRGSRDLELQFQFRNECSDAFSGPWTDDGVTVHLASWELPFADLAPASTRSHFAGAGEVASSAQGFHGLTLVEQDRGGGVPWRRAARVRLDAQIQESAEAFEMPLVAVSDADLLVAAQMPWMRYREPQGLAVEDTTISLRFVSESLPVGEGKGIWNFARVSLVPGAIVAEAPSSEALLEQLRVGNARRLESPLLVHASLAGINAARLYPSMGDPGRSTVADAYLEFMEALHDETVSSDPEEGQWHRAKTYGSQLWPDVQYDPWSIEIDAPYENSGAMNYWNPSGAELFQFLRSGDPRWVWDFAMPQSWLQMFTAYLNVGENDPGNRAGFAVTSGGSGEGDWHRSAYGSDDYSYNMGLELAYAIRPNAALRARFAQAGRTVIQRYSIPKSQEQDRERFVNQVDITRQVIQHFEMLANCAEFVPGAQGWECHDLLQALILELSEDNLRAGLMCQGDVPTGNTCWVPQQFMQNALMYPFFHRIYRNYGDASPDGGLERMLVEAPLAEYLHGIEKRADGESIEVFGDWADAMSCQLSGDGASIVSCRAEEDSDGQLSMWSPVKPHTAALLLMSDELDPTNGLCELTREVYDDPGLTDGWWEYRSNGSGWWKGASQMMQSMVFGVGLYETCLLPEPGADALALTALGSMAALAHARRRAGRAEKGVQK